jgi:hypothetical protein
LSCNSSFDNASALLHILYQGLNMDTTRKQA